MIMKFKAKVKYIDLSGGFWGLVTADGLHYQPINLDISCQQEDIELEVEGKELLDTISIFMWGKSFEITSFKILSA